MKFYSSLSLDLRKLLNKISCPAEIFIYFSMASILILFNFSSLGIDVIFLDDLAQYSEAIEGKFGAARLKRALVNPFINHFFVNIMAYSPPLARALVLILDTQPDSCRRFGGSFLSSNHRPYSMSLPLPCQPESSTVFLIGHFGFFHSAS